MVDDPIDSGTDGGAEAGDQPEGGSVTVPMAVALDGFPAICAITGRPADGAIPLRVNRSATRWKAQKIRIPMSEAVFSRWSSRRNIQIKARWFSALLTVVGIVVAIRNAGLGIAILAGALAVHLVDLWAERSVGQLEPTIERVGGEVRVSGVHDAFAAAVRETVH